MMTGVIGLGNLGLAIATRLESEGVPLTVWNRTPGKAKRLAARLALTPAELISASDITILNLFDSDAVESVFTRSDGLLSGDCKGKIILDTTTNHPARVAGFHQLLLQHGAQYLEAPVLGSIEPALRGALVMLVSGDPAAMERVRPIGQKLCKKIFYLGAPGIATRMKLVNNLVLATFMASIAEAGAMGERVGIGLDMVLNILSEGAGNSTILRAKKTKLTQGDFSAQFSVSAMQKDIDYLTDLCRELGVLSPNLDSLRVAYGDANLLKHGDVDFSAVYRVFEERYRNASR